VVFESAALSRAGSCDVPQGKEAFIVTDLRCLSNLPWATHIIYTRGSIRSHIESSRIDLWQAGIQIRAIWQRRHNLVYQHGFYDERTYTSFVALPENAEDALAEIYKHGHLRQYSLPTTLMLRADGMHPDGLIGCIITVSLFFYGSEIFHNPNCFPMAAKYFQCEFRRFRWRRREVARACKQWLHSQNGQAWK
jgi:hypothetical protein